MLLGGMGYRQKILCRGLGEYVTQDRDTSYTLNAVIQDTHAAFYDLNTTLIWSRRARYFLESYLKCSCRAGYSLEFSIRAGHPKPTKVATYGVFKVKVPEYDEHS